MSETTPDTPVLNVPTQVSPYDRVNTALIVSIALSGAALALLTLAWLFQSAPRPTVVAHKLETPTPFKLKQPEPNQLNLFDQSTADSQSLEQTVQQIGSVVAELSLTNGWGGKGIGNGTIGKGTDPRELTPARDECTWSVSQTAAAIDDYQRQLDFFDIQIGVVHKTRKDIWRISDLSAKKTITNSNRSAESSSRRFSNQNNRLRRWDIRIAKEAGFDVNETIVVHFYPTELIKRMRELLIEHVGDRLTELKHVQFRITDGPEGLSFAVDSVKFDSAKN